MNIILQFKNFLRKKIDTTFIFLAKITKTNLTTVGYYQKGILIYGSAEITGEKFVIENVLLQKINIPTPIFFDVGANVGLYSLSLKKRFPDAIVYAFEPNPSTYKNIKVEAINQQIKFYNIGLKSDTKKGLIYDYKDNVGSEHASIYRDVFIDIHHSKNIEEIEFESETLDRFCEINNIDRINFLKIDTEGSEFDILMGAARMLRENNIDIIQFEFNEMNIISRVFLLDYYKLLLNYNIYRITSYGIIPLGKHKTENEIFQYQNFLAINKFLEKT
jgi:FkbM family methyltransferase